MRDIFDLTSPIFFSSRRLASGCYDASINREVSLKKVLEPSSLLLIDFFAQHQSFVVSFLYTIHSNQKVEPDDRSFGR